MASGYGKAQDMRKFADLKELKGSCSFRHKSNGNYDAIQGLFTLSYCLRQHLCTYIDYIELKLVILLAY